MSDVRVCARQPDGTETDITEGVQALYDLVISSMDFRSGIWSAEDAQPVALLARACGFENRDEIERYLREQEHGARQREFILERQRAAGEHAVLRWVTPGGVPLPHGHVFSAAGRCMWPGCLELGEMDPVPDGALRALNGESHLEQGAIGAAHGHGACEHVVVKQRPRPRR